MRAFIVMLVAMLAGVGVTAHSMTSVQAAELNPAAIDITTPDEFVWRDPPGTTPSNRTVLYGDPDGNGYYMYINKFQPGHFSRPHFHANDRFITVLKGTWWVGTGTHFDIDNTVPLPEGSFVTHYGMEVHYDGAKDEEVMVLITGVGPAAGTPAEEPN